MRAYLMKNYFRKPCCLADRGFQVSAEEEERRLPEIKGCETRQHQAERQKKIHVVGQC